MTSTTTDRPTEFFDKAGREITSHDGMTVRSIIDRLDTFSKTKDFIVKARGGEGVAALGLYIELVHYRKGSAGEPIRHTRYFVYGDVIYAASRTTGQSKANWKARPAGSARKALETMDRMLDKPETQVYGRPVLVELKADDISTIEGGQIPGARFRGQYRIEKDFGKFDFGHEVRSEFEDVETSIPHRMAKVLGHIF